VGGGGGGVTAWFHRSEVGEGLQLAVGGGGKKKPKDKKVQAISRQLLETLPTVDERD